MRDFREAICAEQVETVWMSHEAGEEYGLRPFEREAMNRYLVNGWLAMYAAHGRCEN